MDTLDRLERLARLRESGVLSEAEFQAQKARLLADTPSAGRPAPRVVPEAPRRPVWPWLLGAAVLVLAVIGIGLLVGRDVGGAAAANYSAAADSEVPVNEAVPVEPTPTPTPTQAPADYASATAADVLGSSGEALESRLGPAGSKAGGRWTYRIGGCSVTYTVRGDAVTAATMPVGAGCHPVVNGVAITEGTTLGAIGGTFRADCVAACGAAEPVLQLAEGGGNGAVPAVFRARDVSLDAWAAAIRRDQGIEDGDEAANADAFTCVSDPPADVEAGLAEATVSSVTIGRDGGGACRRRASAQP